MLFIGGGGLCLPSYVFRNFPDKQVSVVEIDRVVLKLATKYFLRPFNKNFLIFCEEGLSFLKKNKSLQNSIFIDIGLHKNYDQGLSVDVNKYITKLILLSHKRLKKNGFLLINIMTFLSELEMKWFNETVLKPMKFKYKSVFVFADFPNDKKKLQDLIIIAHTKKINESDLTNNLITNYTFFPNRWKMVKKNISFKNIICTENLT